VNAPARLRRNQRNLKRKGRKDAKVGKRETDARVHEFSFALFVPFRQAQGPRPAEGFLCGHKPRIKLPRKNAKDGIGAGILQKKAVTQRMFTVTLPL